MYHCSSGATMPINISHSATSNNLYITFYVHPYAKLADGTNGGLSFDRNHAGAYGGALSVDR